MLWLWVSGGAGSIAAHAAAETGARAVVVSKHPIRCLDTKISEGAVTVREVGNSSDTKGVLSENLKMAGQIYELRSLILQP